MQMPIRSRYIRIGYQGVPGAYAHEAVERLCGSEVECVGFDSFAATHTALRNGSVDFTLVSYAPSIQLGI